MGSTRREFVKGSLAAIAAGKALLARAGTPEIPKRALGKTGVEVTLFGLGGEGVLRTDGREAEATRVIEAALAAGVTYFDTAPAYSSSELYLGRVLPPHRSRIFIASKTHERSRDAALRLLDRTLSRLKTDHLDLWQMHDLRDQDDLDQIFGKGGALEAALKARDEKKIRFIGLTGHHDPAILVEAMRRHRFDTALLALNAADRVRLPFTSTALAAAHAAQMGVIA
jgi:aryl-alcohol dehydrogenase-like predicted oxidoreductase